nr:hypothetical protein [Mesorhizobium sp.]
MPVLYVRDGSRARGLEFGGQSTASKVTDAASGKVQVNTQEVSLKGKLNGSKSGDKLSLALRPEAISLDRQPGHDTSPWLPSLPHV